MIQDNFTGQLNRTNRKVKQAGFIVLHQTFMPSVLVETGFLTNKSEGAYLNSKNGQAQMGKAIAEAILNYKNSVHTSVTDQPMEAVQKEIAKKEVVTEPTETENPVPIVAPPTKEENLDTNTIKVADKPEIKESIEIPKTVVGDSEVKK